MDKYVGYLIQATVVLGGVLLIYFGAIDSIHSKDAQQEVEIARNMAEIARISTTKDQFQKQMGDQINKILEGISSVRVEMQNKANRK